MSKILENLQKEILSTTRRQLMQKGYKSLTIRSIAKECSIAVGTIYNYYPNKEFLLASVILEDWKLSLERMRCSASSTEDIFEGLQSIFEEILCFLKIYCDIFNECGFLGSIQYSFADRHQMLCNQLSDIIREMCIRLLRPQEEKMIIFIAECLLGGATRNCDYEFLNKIFIRLL